MSDDVIATYDAQAAELAQRYDHEALLAAYRPLDDLLEPRSADALALDIGAGSGRDAAWLATKGYEVVAVEPSSGMRSEGTRRHSGDKIRWLDDRLPALSRVHKLGLAFELILLSAVWQHIAPNDRERAFRKMTALLKPGGLQGSRSARRAVACRGPMDLCPSAHARRGHRRTSLNPWHYSG